MSIQAEITVTLASVEVTDEYQVELRTRKKLTALEPDEAAKLAHELLAAAMEADETLREDLSRATAWSHAFDVDLTLPTCRECDEGKHGACNGQALVEQGVEIWTRPCACSEADHNVAAEPAPELSPAERESVRLFGIHDEDVQP